MKRMLVIAMAIQIPCYPIFADDVRTCGDLGDDNKANWCARPNGNGGLTQGKSECRRISDTQFEYTHCSGSKKTYTDIIAPCCIQSSECPGAFYIAECSN
jgi:hypothetical protein